MQNALAVVHDAESAPPARILDVVRSTRQMSNTEILRAIQSATGSNFGAIARSYIKLAMGPGSISFQDFLNLRLFDPAFHGESRLEGYVGARRNRDINATVNFREDWLAVMSNKVASNGYLTAFGLPVIPVHATFLPNAPAHNPAILPDRAALTAFLTSPSSYPLFGKPLEGMQSLGSIALQSLEADGRTARRVGGDLIPIDQLTSEIETDYGEQGYVFQPLLRPHDEIARMSGERIGCVRMITAQTEQGLRILRTCWKIPAGGHAADNYWRAGNMLAQMDLQTGRILRACSGAGLNYREHETHPDTGVELVGFQHPHWEQMKALAMDGASIMRRIPLIGWDLACTQDGPVVVEMNEGPDFFLCQLADRRGMIDPEFEAFMAFQARNEAEHVKQVKGMIAKL